MFKRGKEAEGKDIDGKGDIENTSKALQIEIKRTLKIK